MRDVCENCISNRIEVLEGHHWKKVGRRRCDKWGDRQGMRGKMKENRDGSEKSQARCQPHQQSLQYDRSSVGGCHLLHELHELCTLARSLVVTDQIFEVVRVHDNVQTADIRQSDFVGSQAGEAHFLPGVDAVGLGGCVHCLSVLLQVDVAEGELGVVVDVDEEDLGRFEQTLVIAPLA